MFFYILTISKKFPSLVKCVTVFKMFQTLQKEKKQLVEFFFIDINVRLFLFYRSSKMSESCFLEVKVQFSATAHELSYMAPKSNPRLVFLQTLQKRIDDMIIQKKQFQASIVKPSIMKSQKRKLDGLDILCEASKKAAQSVSRKFPLENVFFHDHVNLFFQQCKAANFSITFGIFHLCFCSQDRGVPENTWVKEKDIRNILNFRTNVEMRHVYTSSKFDYRPENPNFCGVERSNDLPVRWKITNKELARQSCVLCNAKSKRCQ